MIVGCGVPLLPSFRFDDLIDIRSVRGLGCSGSAASGVLCHRSGLLHGAGVVLVFVVTLVSGAIGLCHRQRSDLGAAGVLNLVAGLRAGTAPAARSHEEQNELSKAREEFAEFRHSIATLREAGGIPATRDV